MGVCLLVVRKNFKDEIPTLADYARQHGVSTETLRRIARMLLRPAVRLLRARRPGPARRHRSKRGEGAADASAPSPHPVLAAANALLKALLSTPITTLIENSARLRGVVVEQALYWSRHGVTREHIASLLGVSGRTLRRWTRRSRCGEGGREVPRDSRRPHHSPARLEKELQEALWKLAQAFPELRTAELTRIFNRRSYGLLRKHGFERISARTAGRYLRGARPAAAPAISTESGRSKSPRGAYVYPAPFSMAWMDTTYFSVAGVTIHIIGAMEARCRIALSVEAVVQDSAETTVELVERTLARIPDLAAVVRDRGTPYLNERVTSLLASRGVLPIDAHPYFPIDKAALERWWGTLKDWLRHALRPFEDECRRRGVVPTKARLAELVRPALRVFARAYNLLPQPYLDGQSPVERVEAALRDNGEPGFDLSSLSGLATAREGRNELLTEIRGGLQLETPLSSMCRDFVGISNSALREAMRACTPKLVIERDPEIRNPYRYFLAVAKSSRRAEERRLERLRRDLEIERLRTADKAATEEALMLEDETRRLHPEQTFPPDAERWAGTVQHPIGAVRRRARARLVESLTNLRRKFGAAAIAVIAETRNRILTAASTAEEPSANDASSLLAEFDVLTSATPQERTPHESTRAPPTGWKRDRPSSSCPPYNPVRKALDMLRTPHVYRTDVPS